MFVFWRALGLCCMTLATLWMPAGAFAQDSSGGVSSGIVTRQARIELAIRQFGLGGIVRPGDWAGLEVTVRQQSGEPTRAAVQVHRRDPDGDTLLARREISLATGADRRVWVYVPLDWNLRPTDGFTITVRELPESATGLEVAVGEQIGAASFLANQIARDTEQLIGVVGPDTFGIEQYELRAASGERFRTAHSEWRVVQGLAAQDLPDRWMGLAPFGVLLWSAGDPAQLTGGRAEALREWVRRGGHLIVVLDDINPPWLASSQPLRTMLPEGSWERREDVNLEQFRNLLLRPGNPLVLPQRSVGYVFVRDSEAGPGQAAELLEADEGAVVARRLIGAGMVTVVGLDLRNRALAGGVDIRADQFWHRLLGQRFLIPSTEDLADSSMARRLQALRVSSGEATVDSFIAGEINRSTAVGIGLLLGIIVFAAYWIVAGPGGFAVLKARGKSHLAWPAFVVTAVVFSIVGWVGARALSPAKVSGVHITFLDSVAGEPTQHARSWVSILLPEYGERQVSVEHGVSDLGYVQTLMPWSSPDQIGAVSFPDARSYVLSSADPSVAMVPARSTVKQIRADWLGGAVWEMPVAPAGADRPSASPQGLRGQLVHNLPGSITNVTIVLNLGMENERVVLDSYLQSDRRGQISRTRTHAWRKNPAGPGGADWAPGEVLDLSAYRISGDDRLEERLLRDLPGVGIGGVGSVGRAAGISLVNWIGHIPGPRLTEVSTNNPPRALQRGTHGLDLSAYLAQPCIIITGEVEGESPVPIRVAGREIEMTGRTVVRWIFPLQPDPLQVRGERVDPPSSGGATPPRRR